MILRFVLIIAVLTGSAWHNKCAAQKKPDTLEPGIFYEPVETWPEFPGGFDSLKTFLATNLKPINGLKGKRGILTFVVEKDGSLTNIRMVKGFSPEADAEAVRVMKLSPKWKPGTQNNLIMRRAFSIPIPYN